jgi:DNA-binding PadR family transcriptional regulator
MAILIKEPTYAYDVKKKIRKSFGFNPSTITLYTVIYRLNKEGLIRMRSSEPKVYEVTEAGKKAYVKAVKYLETSVNKLKSVMD